MTKTQINKADLIAKMEGIPHAKLMASLSNPQVSAEIKKYIERELDNRADRGTSRGFREIAA